MVIIPHVFNYYYCFSGFLGPVTNINSSIDNCSNIYITWDSPRVDDDRVSIQHYLLTIYDNITGIIVDDYTVYGTSYQFEDRDLFIHRYTYIIAGVNELGEGTSNINTFSYQRGIVSLLIFDIVSIIVPRSATESTFEIFNFTENNATIIFNIPVSMHLDPFVIIITLILGYIRVYWWSSWECYYQYRV